MIRLIDRTGSRRGFTLAEVLIAMGILAVGMSMVAALFPAAIKESERSSNAAIGGLLNRNVLTLVATKLKHPLPVTTMLTDRSDMLYGDQKYADAPGNKGMLLLARQWTGGVNDYQLVVISYSLYGTGNQAAAQSITSVGAPVLDAVTGAPTLKVSPTDAKYLCNGSPVINKTDGTYAMIKRVSGDTATLDRLPIPLGAATSTSWFVVVERQAGQPPSAAPLSDSPAMAVMVSRTSLAQ